MTTTTLLLARHGETDWNRERRFQGHADAPLNDLGRRQSKELADALADEAIDAVYTSPLGRARETADIVARRLGLEARPLDALREVDVGSWSGLTRDEIAERFPEAYARWLDAGVGWTDGETYEALSARVVPTIHELCVAHPGEKVLIVTHGGPIRAVLAHAAGLSFRESRRIRGPLANCEVITVRVTPDDVDILPTGGVAGTPPLE